MCEFYIEDPLFKELFNDFFSKGVTEEAMVNIDKAITDTFDSEIVIDILNIIKASVISKDDFATTYKRIRRYVDSKTHLDEKEVNYFIIALSLKYLITQKSDGIETLIRTKRDFIKEVIQSKFKVRELEITPEMYDEILKTPGDVYSIDDPPINDWDKYFFNICRQVARNSKCLSRRIGAVLVEDKSIISTGYNGPPRGIPKCDTRWLIDANFMDKYTAELTKGSETVGICPRHSLGAKSGEMLNICVAAHAEENAILDAARRGIKTKGATLYMTCGIPCFRCLIKIIQAGIVEIVVTGIKFYDDNAEFLINNSNLKVRLYNF